MSKIIKYLIEAKINEIRRAKEIGIKGTCVYIGHACVNCGRIRWVKLNRGIIRNKKCPRCGNNRKTGVVYTGQYFSMWVESNDFYFPMCSSPRKTGGYIPIHRLVIAKHLGRCLHSWELVHHLNGDKKDNRIENLQIVSDYGHKQVTLLEKRINDLETRVTQLEGENVLLRNRLSDFENKSPENPVNILTNHSRGV